MNNVRFLVLIGMVLIAAASRLIPHPPNFTPIAAMALFGGASFTNPVAAFLVPLGAMLLSDAVLGFHGGMPVVYACFALTVAIGFLVRTRRCWKRVTAATLGSSILFFVATNFAVWARGSLYPRTWEGLVTCYAAAIPFFRNTLAGDALYAAVLFGGFALVNRWLAAFEALKLQVHQHNG